MSALQVGQGLTTLRTRIVRPAFAPRSSGSPRPCRSRGLRSQGFCSIRAAVLRLAQALPQQRVTLSRGLQHSPRGPPARPGPAAAEGYAVKAFVAFAAWSSGSPRPCRSRGSCCQGFFSIRRAVLWLAQALPQQRAFRCSMRARPHPAFLPLQALM